MHILYICTSKKEGLALSINKAFLQSLKNEKHLGSGSKGQLKSRYGFISVSALLYCTTVFGGEYVRILGF